MDENSKKHLLKTGTTTLGIVTKEGIVMAADRKATFADSRGGVHYVADEMEKIKEFNKDIILAMAGTATFCLRAIRLCIYIFVNFRSPVLIYRPKRPEL